MFRWLGYASLLLFAGGNLLAQDGELDSSDRGFTFYERFQGSVNALGAVNDLDSSVGYKFNSHFGIDGGLPIYFVHASSSSAGTATAGAASPTSSNGIGNVYGQARLTFANPLLNYESTLTGTAPTGDKASGFSTGHATVDWSNYFDHSFSSLTPFVTIGLANSISDTMFFVRPYTTYGLVTHVEGGARYRLARIVSVGASLYDVAPSGQQTVVSRIVKTNQGTVTSSRKNHGAFETASVTTGSSNIASDRGFSTWVQVQPVKTLGFYGGYSRSTQYSLNTVFFGVSLNLGSVVRSLGI
jgi:hypothetical protein